jgi:ABC-type lipoprotein release transport system permease subunit
MRWFISIRYLLTHVRQSLVCIAGVTISVMMFITMTAMMNGFTDKFIIETVESSGHITIHDEPRETNDAGPTAGLHQTSSISAAPEWSGTRLVAPRSR